MKLRYEIPRHAFGDRYTHFTDSSMIDLAEQMEGTEIKFKDKKAGEILSASYHAQDEVMDLVLHIPDNSEIAHLITADMFTAISRGI